MKRKIFSLFFLFLIFALALFLRTYFCYDKVFSEPIKYAADDGVYHMRLIENELLGNHFPRRIYFDPYTYFPYGTYIHFTPLYTQILTVFIWLVSLGKPTLELINKIAPFYPAVLGSLLVFVIYFIAKALWNRKIAFLSAVLIAVSPPFLFRSLLGATDHHVAEVLFSTLAMMFLFFALKYHNQKRKFWVFTVLTGFSLGLYLLTWTGGLLFASLIFIFAVLYYLIDYFSGGNPAWILRMGAAVFSIVLLMIVPFLGHPDIFQGKMYNIQHLEILGFGILGLIFLDVLGFYFKKKNINPKLLPIFLVAAFFSFLVILRFFLPVLWDTLITTIQSVQTGMVPHKLAREIINEMQPLGLQGALDVFSILFYLSLVGLIIIFYNFLKNKKPEFFIIFIWTTVVILMSGLIPVIGQRRFSYYLSVNISLLSAFLIVKIFEFGWTGLKKAQQTSINPEIRPYLIIGNIFVIFNAIFFLLFPCPLNLSLKYPETLPYILQRALWAAKQGPPVIDDDWYEALKWLKENTPDPGIDYYGLYPEPGVNKETGKINPYFYPEESYGVLAKWDVGHIITYYAHRIPNANPFQQGIGKKENDEVKELGEGVFFLETDEEKAIKYLDELKTKYIITDYESTLLNGSFLAKIKWVRGDFGDYQMVGEESEKTGINKFDNSMLIRLHILDGGSEESENIKPLDHFRLVYESKTKFIYSIENCQDDIKKVKVFEYVEGARIVGRTIPGSEVVISTEITTNRGRKFIYQKSVEAKDGSFEFIVPYSTFGEGGRLPDQTQFAVFTQPYKLKFGDKEIEINVSEEDVLNGKVIEFDINKNLI